MTTVTLFSCVICEKMYTAIKVIVLDKTRDKHLCDQCIGNVRQALNKADEQDRNTLY